MFQNNNRAIVRRLSFKCLQTNRKRNIVAVLAIALTTILFTTVFTVGKGAIYSVEQQMLRQGGTKFDAEFKFLTEQQFSKIETHPSFQDIGERQYLALAENDELIKRLVEIDYGNEVEAEGKYSVPTTGRMPQSIDEAAVDTAVLDLLGVPHKIGTEFLLIFSVNGELRERKVKLTGYWEGDVDDDFCYLWVSNDFVAQELVDVTLPESGYSGAGNYYVSVNFSNHQNLEKKVDKVLTDFGFNPDAVLGDPLYITTNINRVYEDGENNSIDITLILAVAGLMILILISGYLIIYNIFQISVVKDIRQYGQLKTLGTSPKQLRIILYRQGLLLSAIGIPIGLIIGYLLARLMVPLVMSTSNYEGIAPPPNALVFIGSAIFALLTVFISFRKPAKTVATISPIEALEYSGVESINRKQKKSQGGAKIVRMAASNLVRNPRKTAVVIISISLSTVLLNSVLTYTGSSQLEKFIERDVVSDFVVSDAHYGRGNQFAEQSGISESVINTIQGQYTFKDGGVVYYYTPADLETRDIRDFLAHITDYNGIETEDSEYVGYMLFYGMDKFSFELLDELEGDLDWEKFRSGGYIIEFATYSDYEKVDVEDYKFKPGDKITLECGGVTREYEVLARAACKNKMTSGLGLGAYTSLVVSSSEFLDCFPSASPLLYLLNVDEDGVKQTDSFLQGYTEQVESGLKYTSKQTIEDQFYETKRTNNIAGIILAAIFAVIGLLNFINVIATGILSRKKELAVMQSIGMTKHQLRRMLVLEGLWYAVLAIMISLVISIAASLLLVRPITNSIWHCTYSFTLIPAIIVIPFYILVGALIPFIVVAVINRGSAVDRLKETGLRKGASVFWRKRNILKK